jgi:hypothetical protein
VGNGIVVDVSKYFTKIVAFDPIKKRWQFSQEWFVMNWIYI